MKKRQVETRSDPNSNVDGKNAIFSLKQQTKRSIPAVFIFYPKRRRYINAVV